MQIRWDRDSPAVRDAEQGSLVIEDGPVPRAILLDPAHLRTGTFTYGRQTERVDVALTVHGPTSQTVREVATYLGNLPPTDPAGGKQRDDATKELRGRTKNWRKQWRTSGRNSASASAWKTRVPIASSRGSCERITDSNAENFLPIVHIFGVQHSYTSSRRPDNNQCIPE